MHLFCVISVRIAMDGTYAWQRMWLY